MLAAGVAHEINNPIGYISSNISFLSVSAGDLALLDKHFAELLNAAKHSSDQSLQEKHQILNDWYSQSGIADTIDDIHEVVVDCEEGLNRVKDIVSSLRTFARRDEQDLRLININDCVNSTLKLVSNELKYHCDLRVNLGDTAEVFANEGKINQVLTNLLVNAGHAIEDKGWIQVTSGSRHHEPLGLCTWVSVEDNGSGIAPENLQRVFEPFYTSKEVGQGTGLGLAISYSIIEKLGGVLEVESELNRGTRFTAYLPVAK